MKILLDTDIGSDIDDAMCLTYLLANSQCELLGITTVSGGAETRAELASAICRRAGLDVPVRAGLDRPLAGEQLQPEVPQKEALARWDHETGFEKGTAVDFMAETIRSNPGEVLLLTIGPLTNVAALFDAHPDVPSLLKGLVMMAGTFPRRGGKGRYNEWNVRCDPEAATKVYSTPVALHRSVGLNVTVRVQLPPEELRTRCRHDRWGPALDMAEVWFRERPVIMFHDPLAGASLFDDTILSWNRGTVSVGTAGDDRGSTTLAPADDGPHEAASWVDADRFFEHFFSVAG
jgi:purine nucleosidase